MSAHQTGRCSRSLASRPAMLACNAGKGGSTGGATRQRRSQPSQSLSSSTARPPSAPPPSQPQPTPAPPQRKMPRRLKKGFWSRGRLAAEARPESCEDTNIPGETPPKRQREDAAAARSTPISDRRHQGSPPPPAPLPPAAAVVKAAPPCHPEYLSEIIVYNDRPSIRHPPRRRRVTTAQAEAAAEEEAAEAAEAAAAAAAKDGGASTDETAAAMTPTQEHPEQAEGTSIAASAAPAARPQRGGRHVRPEWMTSDGRRACGTPGCGLPAHHAGNCAEPPSFVPTRQGQQSGAVEGQVAAASSGEGEASASASAAGSELCCMICLGGVDADGPHDGSRRGGGGGWGYTRCRGPRSCNGSTVCHFSCLRRWIATHGQERAGAERVRGGAPLLRYQEAGCPVCKQRLSASSTRMLRVGPELERAEAGDSLS